MWLDYSIYGPLWILTISVNSILSTDIIVEPTFSIIAVGEWIVAGAPRVCVWGGGGRDAALVCSTEIFYVCPVIKTLATLDPAECGLYTQVLFICSFKYMENIPPGDLNNMFLYACGLYTHVIIICRSRSDPLNRLTM